MTSLQLEVWRKAMNDAAAAVQRIIASPPPRAAGETLTRYIDRVQDAQNRAIARWQLACEHHASVKRAVEAG